MNSASQASKSEFFLKAHDVGTFTPPEVGQDRHEHRYQLRYWVAYNQGVAVAWCAAEVTPGGSGLCWYDHAPEGDDQNLASLLFYMRLAYLRAINCIALYRAPGTKWGRLYRDENIT
jgi:hypothetical protein